MPKAKKAENRPLDMDLLITQVQERPHIYDPEHHSYRDAEKICNIWEEITTILNTDIVTYYYNTYHYKVNVIKYCDENALPAFILSLYFFLPGSEFSGLI